MTRAILIILGIIFILNGIAGFSSSIKTSSSIFIISIFSGLFLIVRGTRYTRIKKKKEIPDPLECKLLASKLYLKGKSDKEVLEVLLKKGMLFEKAKSYIIK